MNYFRTFLTSLLTLVFIAALPLRSAAQPAPEANALGVRITGNMNAAIDFPGAGAELSYQRFIGPRTRIEVDLGTRIHDYYADTKKFKLDAMFATSFQWRWPVGRTAGFYAGPVLQFGRPDYALGLGVQTGFDWQFNGPLQLSVDARPTYNWFLYNHFDACIGVGLRYLF